MVVTAEEDLGFQARRGRPVSQQYTLGHVAVQTAGLTQRTRRLAKENASNSSVHTLNNTHSTYIAGDQQEVIVRTAVAVDQQEVPVRPAPAGSSPAGQEIHKAYTHNTYHNPIYKSDTYMGVLMCNKPKCIVPVCDSVCKEGGAGLLDRDREDGSGLLETDRGTEGFWELVDDIADLVDVNPKYGEGFGNQ